MASPCMAPIGRRVLSFHAVELASRVQCERDVEQTVVVEAPQIMEHRDAVIQRGVGFVILWKLCRVDKCNS